MPDNDENKSDGGRTVFGVFEPPRPWPPGHLHQLRRTGELAIIALPTGQFRLDWDIDGRRIQVVTQPVCFRGSGLAVLAASAGGERTFVTLNDRHLLDPEVGIVVVRLRQSAAVGRDDTAIDEARSSRSEYRRTLKSTRDLSEFVKQRRSLLNEELEAMADLVDLVTDGAVRHVPGLAVSLRKLVVRGRGNQLIRDIAAVSRATLSVHASRDWVNPITLAPEAALMTSISPDQTSGSSFETDLELWLEHVALQMGGKQYSHAELIKEIADKAGAHRDYDEGAAIELLRSWKALDSEVIVIYLLRIARTVLVVGRRLYDDCDIH